VEERWNPWAALRARPDLEFGLAELPAVLGGAVYAPQPEGWAAIVIDRGLDQRRRRAALSHELVHHERGGGCPTDDMPVQWAPVVRREENVVAAEVARRLVPREELRAFVERMTVSELGGASARDIAEHFDVPDEVAALAVHQLGPEGGRP